MRIPTIILAAVLVISLARPVSATGSISITSISIPSSVSQGDSFTITMSVSGSEATDVKGSLTLPSGLSCTPSGTQDISLSGGTGSASWSCSADVAGDYTNQITASVTATDTGTSGSLSDSEQTGLNVLSPASLTSSSSIASSSVTTSGSTTFTVSVHNTGDESSSYSISVASSPSGMSTSLSSGSASGTVSGNSISTAKYTASSSSANTYTITATTTGNGQTLTTSQTLAVTAASSSSSSSSGGGGGGGGGAGGGTKIHLKPGLGRAKGLIGNTNLQAAIEKVLAKGKLSDAAKQNLLDLSALIARDSILTRDAVAAAGKTYVTTTIKYNGKKKVKDYMLYDTVPKSFAQNAVNITVTAVGATVKIVKDDPEFLIHFREVLPGQTLTINYSVNRRLASMSSALNRILQNFSSEVYGQPFEEAVGGCADGELRCSEGNVEKCGANIWTVAEVCNYGCANSACRLAPDKRPKPPAKGPDPTLGIIIAVIAIVIIAALFIAFKKKPPATKDFSPTKKSTVRKLKSRKKKPKEDEST